MLFNEYNYRQQPMDFYQTDKNTYTTPTYTTYNDGYGSNYNSYNNDYNATYTPPTYDYTPPTIDYNLNSDAGLYASNRNYGQFNTGGNLHDTFKVDRYDNVYGGHTTVDLGDNQKIHLGW